MSNSVQEKVFFSAIAAHILGNETGLKLSGSPSKINATKKAISATKRLYEALDRQDIGLDRVHELIQVKKSAAFQFKRETGLTWAL